MSTLDRWYTEVAPRGTALDVLGLQTWSGARRTKVSLLLSPEMSERLVDGGVDRWVRGGHHAPAWIVLDL
jgi:hypothetical protein